MFSSYIEVLAYVTSLASLEMPYEESVGLGNKVVLSKMTGTGMVRGLSNSRRGRRRWRIGIFAVFCMSL